MTKQTPIVSIIMPAYNAEATIRRSVGAILKQTEPSLELIVVNDGSKDGTEAVLRELAETDDRLRILTVPNGGPAKARNAGLEAVSPGTEYIMFSDADDELLPDAAEAALRTAETEKADLVIFGFTIVNPDGTRNDYFEPRGSYTPENLGSELANLYKANLLNQVWAKLFRADLIRKNGIRFADYRWGEDRLFIFDCLEHLDRLAVLPECRYRYIMQAGESLITGYYDRKPDVCLLADRRAQELCSRFGVAEDGYFRYMFAKSEFSCLTNLYSPSCRLSRTEKRAYTARIVKDDRVKERCRGAAGGLPTRLVCAVLSSGNVTLGLAAASCTARLGRIAPKLFQKIKHRK